MSAALFTQNGSPRVSPKEILSGSRHIDETLLKYLDARSQARKFHGELLGSNVNPDYNFADFLCAVQTKDQLQSQRKLDTVYKTAINEASGIAGGYLVPVDFTQELLADIAGKSYFWSHCHIEEMASLTKSIPVLDATTPPSAKGVAPFWGGLIVKPFGEAVGPAESEPRFRLLELNAWAIGAYALASNQLVQDGGVGLVKWLITAFAKSMAWYEDWYFINGSGVGQPLGVINAGASTIVNRQTPSSFTAQDAQNMVSSLYNITEAHWLFSRTVLAKLTQITGWFPNGPLIIHGMDVVPTMLQPALGTIGDVILLDPSLYVIGKREEIQIDFSRDEPTNALNWRNVWRFIHRVDGQPLLNNDITIPDGGSTTVGASVILN